MPFTTKDIARATRVVGDTGLWVGQWMKREIFSSLTDICSVCNNLQPHGHEDTLGRTPNSVGRWVRHESYQQRTDLVNEPALFIRDITTKELLRCRDIDPKTRQPFRPCRYCRLICKVLDTFFIDKRGNNNWVEETRSGVYLRIALMIREGAPLVINCIGQFLYDPSRRSPRVDLELFCESEHISGTPGVPTMGNALPRIMNTLDQSCIRFAQECIQQCLAEHPRCSVESSIDFAPTRLVQLNKDGGDEINLCEAIPSPVSWAALSHCWGGSKPLMLYKNNMAMLRESIKLQELPATFKNAISVCRGLGMRYLWIDSLCIVQDDKNDWEREAAQMGKVYSQATLVIIGASSGRPEVPFLGPRDESWSEQTIEFETPAGVRIPIKARKRHLLAPRIDHGHLEPPFTKEWAFLKRAGPLYTRAWCFQESFLARRSLHFSPGSLFFECKTHRRSNESLPPYPLLHDGSLGHVTDAAKWRLLVESYTQRQLTFASDKLPAISGIASLLPQAGRGSRYLAGLWEESLLGDLLWHVLPTAGSLSARAMAYTAGPGKLDCAPSWSWASLPAAVSWTVCKSFEPRAQILKAECSILGTNPYGTVSAGEIVLRGRLLPCFVKYSAETREHHAYCVDKGGSRSKDRWFLSDGMLSPVQGVNTQMGPLCQRFTVEGQDRPEGFDSASAYVFGIAFTGRSDFNHVGLVLASSMTHAGGMERIGKISNLPRDWFDGGSETTIRLV